MVPGGGSTIGDEADPDTVVSVYELWRINPGLRVTAVRGHVFARPQPNSSLGQTHAIEYAHRAKSGSDFKSNRMVPPPQRPLCTGGMRRRVHVNRSCQERIGGPDAHFVRREGVNPRALSPQPRHQD